MISVFNSKQFSYISIQGPHNWQIVPGDSPDEWWVANHTLDSIKDLHIHTKDIPVLLKLLEALDREINNTENEECPF
jgi:hypothetical protein